jgi:hypothetical protein
MQIHAPCTRNYTRTPNKHAQLVEAPLPKVPRDVGIAAHWLAINGQQPAIPENAPIEQAPPKRPRLDQKSLQKQAAAAAAAAAAQQQQQDTKQQGDRSGGAKQGDRSGGAKGGGGAAGGDAAVQPPVRHQLTRELQVYFDRLVGLLQAAAAAEAAAAAGAGDPVAAAADLGRAPGQAVGGGGGGAAAAAAAAERQEALFRAALSSLSTDPGLHPLAPYFTAYIADGVAHSLGSLPLLRRLLSLARALLVNPAIHLNLYLHQLLPSILTCLMTKTLGPRGGDDHWAVRDQAAALAAAAARAFGEPYHNVAPRLVRMMAKAYLDPSKGFACKYGAVVGLKVGAGSSGVRSGGLHQRLRGWRRCPATNHKLTINNQPQPQTARRSAPASSAPPSSLTSNPLSHRSWSHAWRATTAAHPPLQPPARRPRRQQRRRRHTGGRWLRRS